jgi:hypothetical protein
MTNHREKHLKDFLIAGDTSLGGILLKANYLQILNKKFLTLLDKTLRNHCQIANLREDTLIIAAENASIATRLRYEAPALLTKLKLIPEFAELTSIQLYIAPKPLTKEYLTRHPHATITLSPENAQLLAQTANSVEDESLKEALLRLAAGSD